MAGTRLYITVGLVLLIACLSPSSSQGAAQGLEGASTKITLDPETLVREWFARLNTLDDWSPENAENQVDRSGPEESKPEELDHEESNLELGSPNPEPFVESFVELYRPDAFIFVRPNQHQMGPVMYYEHAGVRAWANYYAKTFFDLAYRLNTQTAREITTELFYSTPLPWGGLAVSVEFTAVYTFRDGEKKFTAPGAAFFQFAEDGRIQRLRLYELKDETFGVVP